LAFARLCGDGRVLPKRVLEQFLAVIPSSIGLPNATLAAILD
jgi:hypothetical protein